MPAVPGADRGRCPVPRTEARLIGELSRIDVAEYALISELEPPGDPADPAMQAYRARIRARYAELYDQRTRTETQLKALYAETPDDSDPDPLDALPIASAVFAAAPDRVKEALLTAFDISVLYRHDLGQVTIRAALTDDTPRTVTALLDAPRTDSDTASITPGQHPSDHSAPTPMGGAVTLNHGGAVTAVAHDAGTLARNDAGDFLASRSGRADSERADCVGS